jgi:hypothetical protein
MDFNFDYEDYCTAQVTGECLGCGCDTEPANEHEYEVVCTECLNTKVLPMLEEVSNDNDLPF